MSDEAKDAPESNAIATRPTSSGSGILLRTFDEHKQFAMAAFHAGILDGDNSAAAVGKALISMQYGAEVGLGPMSSLQGINVIKGKPAMGAALMGSLIQGSGTHRYQLDEGALTDDSCTIRFFEKVGAQWEERAASTFTQADAKKAGLTGGRGDMYSKFPRNLLFARALSNGARWHCPSIFHGAIYTPEELGGAIDAEFTPAPATRPEVAETQGNPIDAEVDEHPEPASKAARQRQSAPAFAEYEGGPSVKMYRRICEYAGLDAIPANWKKRLGDLASQACAGQLTNGAAGKAIAAVKEILEQKAAGAAPPRQNIELWDRLAQIMIGGEIGKDLERTIRHLMARQQKGDEPAAADLLTAIADAAAVPEPVEPTIEAISERFGGPSKLSDDLATNLAAETRALVTLGQLYADDKCDQSIRKAIDSTMHAKASNRLKPGEAVALLEQVTGYLDRVANDPDFDGVF